MMIAERVGGLEAINRLSLAKKMDRRIFVRSGEVLQELMNMGAFEPNVNGIKPDGSPEQVRHGPSCSLKIGTWEISILNAQMGPRTTASSPCQKSPAAKAASITHRLCRPSIYH